MSDMDKYILIYQNSEGEMTVVSDNGSPYLFDSYQEAHEFQINNMTAGVLGKIGVFKQVTE